MCLQQMLNNLNILSVYDKKIFINIINNQTMITMINNINTIIKVFFENILKNRYKALQTSAFTQDRLSNVR